MPEAAGQPARARGWRTPIGWEEGEQPTRSAIFARLVRREREARGWSQGELARRLADVGHPIGQSRVSAIEAPGPDPRTIGVDQAQAFADAFGVPLEALMFEDYTITRTVLLRELVALLEIGDAFASAAVASANQARELAVRYLQQHPGQLPGGMTALLAPMELQRQSVEDMLQAAGERRRDHHEGEGHSDGER